MSNEKLVKAAVVALGCTFGLVGCGTYNHNNDFMFFSKGCERSLR